MKIKKFIKEYFSVSKKRLGFLALIIVLTGVIIVGILFVWPNVIVPLVEVKFKFTLKDVTAIADSDERLTFAIISDVHFRNTSRGDIPDKEETIGICALTVLRTESPVNLPVEVRILSVKETFFRINSPITLSIALCLPISSFAVMREPLRSKIAAP